MEDYGWPRCRVPPATFVSQDSSGFLCDPGDELILIAGRLAPHSGRSPLVRFEAGTDHFRTLTGDAPKGRIRPTRDTAVGASIDGDTP
jgi:hypothetical protein